MRAVASKRWLQAHARDKQTSFVFSSLVCYEVQQLRRSICASSRGSPPSMLLEWLREAAGGHSSFSRQADCAVGWLHMLHSSCVKKTLAVTVAVAIFRSAGLSSCGKYCLSGMCVAQICGHGRFVPNTESFPCQVRACDANCGEGLCSSFQGFSQTKPRALASEVDTFFLN